MASRSNDSQYGGRKSSSVHQRRPLSLDEICATGAPPPPLVFGDRVVWLSDSGPEFGLVKWLGKLPDVGSDWMAGVVFDNAVGSGTGLYNDHQLFNAPMNHASLVPVIGLMKATDFGGEPSMNLADVPQKPRRSKQRKDSFGDRLPQPLDSSSAVVSLQQHMSDLLLPDSKDGSERHSPLSPKQAPVGSNPPFPAPDTKYSTVDGKTGKSNSLKSVPTLNGKHSDADVEIGSMVEVTIDSFPRYGVIRWIGTLDDTVDADRIEDDRSKLVAGVELEEECAGCCDGSWNGRRYFACAARKGYFVSLR